MAYLPELPRGRVSRAVTDSFLGYDHRLAVPDGAFYDTGNLCTLQSPVLASRPRRGRVREFTGLQGLTALGGALAWVDGGTLYYNGIATPVTGLSPGRKQLVTTGACICVFPDGKYCNTASPEDSGSMCASLTAVCPRVTFRMSNSDGVEYDAAVESAAAPADPAEGELWLDTRYGLLKRWSAASAVWTELTDVYTKVMVPGLPAGARPSDRFRAGDGVSITGLGEGLDGSKLLQAVGEDFFVIIGVLANEYSIRGVTLRLWQELPQADFVIECANRLWGCYYGPDGSGGMRNEIFCCALGDFRNWRRCAGLSTDSWAASVGTEGPWTGAVNYLGCPTFFKADGIHRVSVSASGAHSITAIPCRGVQPGSAESLAIINETLYYRSREGVCAWQGGFPADIGEALGDPRYHSARAGVCGDRYFLSVLDEENVPSLFAADVKRGLWMREDDLRPDFFAACGGELYAAADNVLWALRGTEGEPEEELAWFCETGMETYATPDRKYLSRYNLRLQAGQGATLRILFEYDSAGSWTLCGELSFSGTYTVTVPVRPRRCDHLRMRLEGSGDVKLFSVARILERGSDAGP